MTPSPPSPPMRTKMSFIKTLSLGVTPAEAGVQYDGLDSGFRRNDDLLKSRSYGRPLQGAVNEFFARHGRRRAVADGIGNLLRQLLAHIADRKEPGDRGFHILVRKDVAFFILFQWVFHYPAIRGKAD